MTRPVTRRAALAGIAATLGIGAGFVSLTGCGVYAAEDGEAFDPWQFPGEETVPERVVARAALLAASPHNTQPWGLAIGADTIALRARLDRNLGTMDGLRRELHIGLGCALENMLVAARAVGRAPTVALFPAPDDATLVATVALAPTAAAAGALFRAIAARHTNRGAYADGAPAPGLAEGLRAQLDDPAISLHVLASAAERAAFRAATIAATEAIVADQAMSEDSYRWYRHTHAEIEEHRDGPSLDASGSGAATRTLGKALGRPSRATSDDYWLDATRNRQTTGSAFVILASSRASTRAEQLGIGRAFQRIALWATGVGLALQPLNQLAERQDREEVLGLEPRFGRTLEELVGADRRAQMLFRIGYPWDRAFASPRRPLGWVT